MQITPINSSINIEVDADDNICMNRKKIHSGGFRKRPLKSHNIKLLVVYFSTHLGLLYNDGTQKIYRVDGTRYHKERNASVENLVRLIISRYVLQNSMQIGFAKLNVDNELHIGNVCVMLNGHPFLIRGKINVQKQGNEYYGLYLIQNVIRYYQFEYFFTHYEANEYVRKIHPSLKLLINNKLYYNETMIGKIIDNEIYNYSPQYFQSDLSIEEVDQNVYLIETLDKKIYRSSLVLSEGIYVPVIC